MKVRTLLEERPYQRGLYQIADDASLDVLESTHLVEHSTVLGGWPQEQSLERGYRTGKVIAFHLRDAIVDLDNGAVIDSNGSVIRESFGPGGLADAYAKRTLLPPIETLPRSERPLLPLGNIRAKNICHWYMDTLAKPFVISRSQLAEFDPQPILYRARVGFQRDSLLLLGGVSPAKPGTPRFMRADVVATPGINCGGSPRVSLMVGAYADDLAERRRTIFGDVPGVGKRIFISRGDARYRSIVNEEAFREALARDGFVSLQLEQLTAAEQMAAFAHAEVVIAPHGAGLINMLWSPRKTTIVEIFPEGGTHGSVYLRIASQRRQNYHAVTGRAIGNRDPRGNPKNADLELDLPNVLAFIRSRVLRLV